MHWNYFCQHILYIHIHIHIHTYIYIYIYVTPLQIYATQPLGYGKIRKTLCIKIGAVSFLKETFLVYPTLTHFTQGTRKTYDTNDLLAPSIISVIVSISLLGKSFIVHI